MPVDMPETKSNPLPPRSNRFISQKVVDLPLIQLHLMLTRLEMVVTQFSLLEGYNPLGLRNLNNFACMLVMSIRMLAICECK